MKQYDQNQALQLLYNQLSPQTAVGAGLDRSVKLNGIARSPYSFSTAVLTITGVATTVINNGYAQDSNNNLWALPTPTTIVGGSVNVLAICTTPGNVTAEPGTINIPSTPVNGWIGVTNGSAAVPGAPVETDSQLRARQSISVALPALTPLAASIAALNAITGVTRIAPGYPTPGGAPGSSIENPTGGADSWGNPAHSVSFVVEGGNSQTIANTIYAKKTPGCLTNGTTTESVADPNTGNLENISFSRPTYTPIFVLCSIHGYMGTPSTAVVAAVQAALVAYLNDLAIGETVSWAALNFEAMSINSTLTSPGFGVQSLTLGTLTASTTATLSTSSAVIAVASATGVVNGQLAAGVGITPGTTVINVSGTNITLSANPTIAGTGVTVNFSTLASADVAMANYYYVAEGVVANVGVVTV